MPRGQVSIVAELCLGCGTCIHTCPKKVLSTSAARNKRGHRLPHVVHPERCNGCDLCGLGCFASSIQAKLVDHSGLPAF